MLVHAKRGETVLRGTLMRWLASSVEVEHLEVEPICTGSNKPGHLTRDCNTVLRRDIEGRAPQRQKALGDIPRLGRLGGRGGQGRAAQGLY